MDSPRVARSAIRMRRAVVNVDSNIALHSQTVESVDQLPLTADSLDGGDPYNMPFGLANDITIAAASSLTDDVVDDLPESNEVLLYLFLSRLFLIFWFSSVKVMVMCPII